MERTPSTKYIKDYYATRKSSINIYSKISKNNESKDSKNYNIKNIEMINKKKSNITLKNNNTPNLSCKALKIVVLVLYLIRISLIKYLIKIS